MTVIVSEETGRISLALEGGIESGLTTDTLRAAAARAADGSRARESRELSRPVYE